MFALEINNVSKTYKGTVKALKNVSFKVEEGKIFGLLGPNGAGKTTLIKAILGIVGFEEGDIRLLNDHHLENSVKKRIGYLPENHKYPNFLTGEEVLFHYGSLGGMNSELLKAKIPELLELVDMADWGKTKIKKYSKGMLQRIGLAQALINDPDVVFLDEPTDGIDPVGRHKIHDVLVKLSKQGKTVFINSHMLAEIESVCDDVAILKHGELIKYGSVEEITTEKERYVIELDLNGQDASVLFANFPFFQEKENAFIFEVENHLKLNELLDHIRKNDSYILSVNHVKNSLEETFINLVK